MKKQLFILMALVILVLITNKTFAQTYATPTIGAEYKYKWGNVTASSFSYAVTTTTTSPTANPATGTIFSVKVGSSLTPGGSLNDATSTELVLTWLPPSQGNTYYVWLVAKSADGCENWRYVPVTVSNQVDFVLAALGIFSKTEPIDNLNDAVAVNGGAGCHVPTMRDGAVFNSKDDGVNDGNVYAYFRVSQGAKNNDDTWTFEFEANNGTLKEIEHFDGDSWKDYTTALTGIADDDVKLLRVKIATPIITTATDGTKITGKISNAKETTSNLADSNAANDVYDYTVKPVPTIGGFIEL